MKLGQPVPESNLSSEDDVQVDAEETAFVLRGLSMHLEVLLASAAGRLHEGRYRHKVTFDEHALPARALAREATSIALRRAFLGAIYGRGHPYADPGLASATTCPGASPEALGDFRTRHYAVRGAALIIAGRFDPAAARALVGDLFGDLAPGEAEAPLPPVRPPARATHIAAIAADSATVPIALGWPAAGTGDPRFPARLILTELLNDQMGVIRTRLAASYGVSAHLAAQVAGSSYQVSGQVDARRAGEALTAMRAEVARLRDGQISPEQFARARREAIRSLVASPASSFGLARRVEWMVRHGLPRSGEAELSRRIAAATAADVRAVAGEDLARDHEVVALSGTRATLQAAFAATGIADVTDLGR